MSLQNSLGRPHKEHINPSDHSHQLLPISCSNQSPPDFQSLLVMRTSIFYMYCPHDLPTNTYFPVNSFTPLLLPTLLHTDELRLNSRQKYFITFFLHRLIINSRIMCKDFQLPCLGISTTSCPISLLVLLNRPPWDHLDSSHILSGPSLRCLDSIDTLLFIFLLVPEGFDLPPELSHPLT